MVTTARKPKLALLAWGVVLLGAAINVTAASVAEASVPNEASRVLVSVVHE